jgi:hypothetical protein
MSEEKISAKNWIVQQHGQNATWPLCALLKEIDALRKFAGYLNETIISRMFFC